MNFSAHLGRGFPGRHRDGGRWGWCLRSHNLGPADTKGPRSGSTPGTASAHPEKKEWLPCWFGSLRGTGCPPTSPWPTRERSGPRLQSHSLTVKREAVSVGGPQTPVDEVVDWDLRFGGIIPANLELMVDQQ